MSSSRMAVCQLSPAIMAGAGHSGSRRSRREGSSVVWSGLCASCSGQHGGAATHTGTRAQWLTQVALANLCAGTRSRLRSISGRRWVVAAWRKGGVCFVLQGKRQAAARTAGWSIAGCHGCLEHNRGSSGPHDNSASVTTWCGMQVGRWRRQLCAPGALAGGSA